MKLFITNYYEEEIKFEDSNKEAVLKFAKNMLRNYTEKDIVKAVLDNGEDVIEHFSNIVRPCPCGRLGTDKDCLCSQRSINVWREIHKLPAITK